MASDVQKVITANPVKNGSIIVLVDMKGNITVDNTYVQPNQVIGDISDKYDLRFDDYHYYT